MIFWEKYNWTPSWYANCRKLFKCFSLKTKSILEKKTKSVYVVLAVVHHPVLIAPMLTSSSCDCWGIFIKGMISRHCANQMDPDFLASMLNFVILFPGLTPNDFTGLKGMSKIWWWTDWNNIKVGCIRCMINNDHLVAFY